MKILIISDTHGREENLEDVIAEEAPFDYMIHCGDIENQEIMLEAIADCPCYMVAGNNDFFSDLSDEIVVHLGGKKMWVTHGHHYGIHKDYSLLVEKAKEKQCEIVCFGHIHHPVLEKQDGVLLINPGSLSYPRQRGRKPSYAIMELEIGEEPEVNIAYL